MKMLANQKNRTQEHMNNADEGVSPSAEHLEEPSIVGKRESAGMETAGAATGAEASAAAVAHNIRISDMLKHQSKDIDEIIKD